MAAPDRSVTRFAKRAMNTLGIIPLRKRSSADPKNPVLTSYRNPFHHVLDQYYESTQYDHLEGWDDACAKDDYVAIRKRKPRIIYGFAKALSARVTAKLVGADVWPAFKQSQDPAFEEYLRFIINASQLKHRILEPIRRLSVTGSVFVRFYVEDGQFVFRHYLSKVCFPTLKPSGDLESMTVAYVYDDLGDIGENGEPKKKWYRLDLTPNADFLYDNPIYNEGESWQEASFEVVEMNEHGLGFVQGEWMRTAEIPNEVDGPSFIADILTFIDELNYNISQSSQVIQYNQDPQLVINGLTEEELELLIRSSQKAWNLGKDGKAMMLESNLGAVDTARDFRDRCRLGVQDVARIVLMDPEKIVGHAQSGKALEILHGPLVELINELRPVIEHDLKNLVLKMAMVNLIHIQRGMPAPVTTPPNYAPSVFDCEIVWPPVFQQTMEDLQKKVQVATSASSANIISRETALRWVAKDFDIENVEEEIQRVANQPVLNPFGMF